MKRKLAEGNPYKQIARYLRAVEPLVSDGPEGRELLEALDALSRYLAKTSRDEIEKVVTRGMPRSVDVAGGDRLSKLPLDELETLIASGGLTRRQLETLANRRFGVPLGSMRSFPRIEFLVAKLMNLIENERIHRVIDAAAKKSIE